MSYNERTDDARYDGKTNQSSYPARDDDVKQTAKQLQDHMWIDSFLLNYTEEMDIDVYDPSYPGQTKRIIRRVSMGVTLKSDERVPSKVFHYAASRSLTDIMEKEKTAWLNAETMKGEASGVKEALEGAAHKGYSGK